MRIKCAMHVLLPASLEFLYGDLFFVGGLNWPPSLPQRLAISVSPLFAPEL